MKIASVVCFVLAGLGAIVAVLNITNREAGPPSEFAGYVVGSAIVPIMFLIAGLWLWQKEDLE